MTWVEILDAIKLIFTTLPGEINFVAIEQYAWAVFEAGWSKGAFLTDIIANADIVFPDPRTRPFIVLILQAILDLINATATRPITSSE